MQSSSSPNPSSDLADELSPLDIIEFIQDGWKTIVGCTLLGILGAGIYLLVVSEQYEASAQIKMAQIPNNSLSPLGTGIEEPQALIARMQLPTFYPKKTFVLCGLSEQKNPEVALVSKLKLTILEGVGGTVDLKVRDASKEIAKACVNAVYELIKASQARSPPPTSTRPAKN
jgi:hypothetical protein